MPYQSNADLPPEVRDRYSARCQSIFRQVWNDIYDRTGDEARAFASATVAANGCKRSGKMDETIPGLKIAQAVDLSLSDDGLVSVAFAVLGDPENQKADDIDKDGDVSLIGSLPIGKEVPISAYGHTSWPERGARLPVGRGVIGETTSKGRHLGVLTGSFFTDTTPGRDTYLTVKNLGDLQQWSFGYAVKQRKGTWAGREANINERYDVHEVSPVLIGAGNGTRTLAIKSVDDDDPPAGSTAADDYLRVLEEVKAFTGRMTEIADLRAKEGRVLSTANRERLTALLSALRQTDDFRKEIERLLAETDPERPQNEEDGKALEVAYLRTAARLATILHV